MTIRRDITWLSDQGLIQSVHGGARVLASATPAYSYSFHLRMEKYKKTKMNLAQKALQYLKPNTIIALDAGTTTYELARFMPDDMNLTVICYCLPIMNALTESDGVELISLGGAFQKNTQNFVGPLSLLALRELRVSTLFLATRSIKDGAMYSGNPYDAEIKRFLINVADQVILICDSSKFYSSAGVRVAPLKSVDVLITDDKLDIEKQSTLKDIDLILVPAVDDVEA